MMFRFVFRIYFLLIALPLYSNGQYIINSFSTKTVVLSSTAFKKTISIQGFSLKTSTYTLFFNSLESVSNVTVKIKEAGGKWKKLKSDEIPIEDVPTRNFYQGSKMVRVPLSPFSSFTIDFTIDGAELKMLCRLPFGFSVPADSIAHEIQIPAGMELKYDTSTMDTIRVKTESWKNEVASNLRFTTNKTGKYDSCEPYISYYVLTKKTDQFTDFTGWYLHLINDLPALDAAQIGQITDGISTADTLKWVFDVYDKVRNKITYVAIEDGYGAWVPRNPSKTLNEKKGDCKDMAYLLYSIYSQTGFDAFIALVPTTSFSTNTFLNSSSFNHIICLLRYKGKTYVLDATDDHCPLGFPSRHTQGRSALCFSADSVFYHTIPIVAAPQNTVQMSIQLNISANGYTGKGESMHTGYEASLVRDLYEGSKDGLKKLEKYYSEILGNTIIKDLRVEIRSPDTAMVFYKLNGDQSPVVKSENNSMLLYKNLPLSNLNKPSEGDCHYFTDHLQHIRSSITITGIDLQKSGSTSTLKFNNEYGDIESEVVYDNQQIIIFTDKVTNLLEFTPEQYKKHLELVNAEEGLHLKIVKL